MTPEPVIDQPLLERAGPDPLGIRSSCAMVVNDSRHVTIDTAAIGRLASDLVDQKIPAPVWNEDVHYRGTGVQATERTIGWIFALDTLNFCFWGQDPDPSYRWRIHSQSAVHDGYVALAIALRDAARAGTPIWDPAWLAMVNEDTISRIFRSPAGSAPIPLLPERAAHLRELGEGVAPLGQELPYTAFVERAGGSTPELAEAIVDTFPSFRDVAFWTPTSGLESAIEVRLVQASPNPRLRPRWCILRYQWPFP